jgi:competence protein ComEC
MPTKKQMKKEWWGGQYKHLTYIHEVAKKRDIPIFPIKQGDIFRFDKNSYIKVLYIYDGINTPVGKTDLNDMSAITMIYDYNHKYLLTADLNKKLGSYLAKNAKDIKADILKVPHHGVEGLAPNSFFDKVGAKYFIVPAPAYYWQEAKFTRSHRTKQYIKDNNITTFVNGIHGNITVVSNKNKFYFKLEP